MPAARDLRTVRPDGQNWVFTRAKDRAWALRLLREQRPKWVTAAPPCTNFSMLNWNRNFPKMAPPDVARREADGLLHLKFVAKLYRHQTKPGG